jgi:exosortase A
MPAAIQARGWPLSTWLFFAAVLSVLVAYRETAASFVQVWRGSDTFVHGFLIVPICAFLVWARREALASLTPRPWPLALALLPPLGLAWFVGHATSTLLVEQFSLAAMLPALVCALLGPHVARALAFPLGFLFFAVPFGDVFQPSLMDFTAAFAVRALRMSGVPVVREGLYLSTPVAEWRVVESCSGLGFVVTGFALGCLFASTTYRKTWKRITFAVLSIVVSITANGFRAYILVLVGYASEMRLPGAIGHVAFGWIVYILVMAAFFLVGSAFRDRAPPEDAAPPRGERGCNAQASARPARWISVVGMAVVALGIWPGFLSHLSRPGPERPAAPISPPETRGGWAIGPNQLAVWKPAFAGATSEVTCSYTKDGATVQCYLAFYEHQRQGRELIQFQNVIVAGNDPQWRVLGERERRIRLDQEALLVRETGVRDSDTRLLVWHWYWLPDEFTASREWAKLLQARARLLLHRDHGAVIVLSAPALDDRDAAEQMRQFVKEMLPSIHKALREADTSG